MFFQLFFQYTDLAAFHFYLSCCHSRTCTRKMPPSSSPTVSASAGEPMVTLHSVSCVALLTKAYLVYPAPELDSALRSFLKHCRDIKHGLFVSFSWLWNSFIKHAAHSWWCPSYRFYSHLIMWDVVENISEYEHLWKLIWSGQTTCKEIPSDLNLNYRHDAECWMTQLKYADEAETDVYKETKLKGAE